MYSVRGRLQITDETEIVALLTNFPTVDPFVAEYVDIRESEVPIFIFESHVEREEDKTALFQALKPFVDQFGEQIDWHECTHDKEVTTPCVIAETYVRSE